MRQCLKILGLVVACLLVIGLLVTWSGLYNVAASQGHWAITRAFLNFGMRNSVETHTLGLKVPEIDSLALAQRGAGHYQGGCAPCHGAPGQTQSPITQHMLPEPPYLPDRISDWEPKELFWIVKHGLKYTGMPGWTAQGRDDEVWAMVAFLRRLPDLDEKQYRELALGDVADPARRTERNPRLLLLTGPTGKAIAACARCHGFDGSGRGSGAFPRLTGQSEAYLHRSLENYASGDRSSGIMQPVAAELTAEEMRALAAFYAGIQEAPSPPRAAASDAELIKKGRIIATLGAPEQGVPACISCHGPTSTPLYPLLAGQYSGYVAQQLRLWQRQARGGNAYSDIMAPIARSLNDEQIRAVSLYFESVGSDGLLSAIPREGADER